MSNQKEVEKRLETIKELYTNYSEEIKMIINNTRRDALKEKEEELRKTKSKFAKRINYLRKVLKDLWIALDNRKQQNVKDHDFKEALRATNSELYWKIVKEQGNAKKFKERRRELLGDDK